MFQMDKKPEDDDSDEEADINDELLQIIPETVPPDIIVSDSDEEQNLSDAHEAEYVFLCVFFASENPTEIKRFVQE